MNNLNANVAKKVPYEKRIAELGKIYNEILETLNYVDIPENELAVRLAWVKENPTYKEAYGKLVEALAKLEKGDILAIKNVTFAIPAKLLVEMYKETCLVATFNEVANAAKVA